MLNNMENISFIPNTQKGLEGYVTVIEKHPYRGYIMGFVLALIVYVGVLSGIYWFYIMRPTSEYTQILADLNAKNSVYYPKDDLEKTVYNVNTVISQIYDPVEMVKAIEATYGSDFKTTSWLYNKQKKTIVFSAQASSFEVANSQIAKIKGVKGVVDVSYPGIDKSSDGVGVALNLSIKLK
jgi:hypothetical protein